MFNFQRLNHEGISWKLASPQPCEHYWREYQPLMPLWSVPNMFAKNPRSNHTRFFPEAIPSLPISTLCAFSFKASVIYTLSTSLHHLILLLPTSQVSCCFCDCLAQPSISTSSILFQSITSSTAFMMSLGIPSAAAARPGDGLRLRLPVDLAAGHIADAAGVDPFHGQCQVQHTWQPQGETASWRWQSLGSIGIILACLKEPGSFKHIMTILSVINHHIMTIISIISDP